MPAPKGNKNAKGNKGGKGQLTAYKPEYVERARKACEAGFTDRELASLFGVAESTINQWKLTHVEFAGALKMGKEQTDARVEQSLYRRALGYSHDAVKITVNAAGAETVTPYVEHYPPDTTACIFWLKNRRSAEWRDVKAVELSGEMTHKHVSELSDDEIAAELERIRAAGGATAKAPGKKGTAGVH